MSEKFSAYNVCHNEVVQEKMPNKHEGWTSGESCVETRVLEFRVKRGENIFCPNPSMPLWSSHPKIFLDASFGPAICPYCSTRYLLLD